MTNVKGEYTMGFFIALILIGLGGCFICSIACKAEAKSKEKTMNLYNSMRDKRFENLKAICIVSAGQKAPS